MYGWLVCPRLVCLINFLGLRAMGDPCKNFGHKRFYVCVSDYSVELVLCDVRVWFYSCCVEELCGEFDTVYSLKAISTYELNYFWDLLSSYTCILYF